MSTMLTAFVMGMLGLAVNCLIVRLAAGAWSSFDTRLLFFSSILPILFIAAGFALFEKREANASQFRSMNEMLPLAVVGGAFSSLAIYLSLVITTIVWSTDATGASFSEFLYGVFNPSSLPPLYEIVKSGKQTEVSWGIMIVVDFFVGAFGIFQFIPRQVDDVNILRS